MGRLSGRHWDEAENPDVSWVFFCRDLDTAPLIAVIGHHRKTGATCFFESRKGIRESALPAPLSSPDEPAAAREDVWLDPAGIGDVRCPDCHDADPWIHSPFIDQVKDPDNPDVPVVPSGADRGRPYYAVASPFEDWPRQVSLEGNACLQCHRIGTGDRAAIFVRAVTDRGRFDFRSDWARAWPQSHWMPPDGASSLEEWNAAYGDSVAALLECLEGPSQDPCSTEIPGAR